MARVVTSFFIALLAAAPAVSCAQAYPTRVVRLIVPFTPAGTTDLVARLVAQKLTESLGQRVVVENRPGAGGAIGVEVVARAPADGYTLVMGHIGTFGINPALYPKLPYDPIKDFAPVTLVAMVPNMLVVHPSLPVRSVRDLVTLARSKPRELNYGSGGIGAASHLAVELFKLLTKTDMLHIPYKGAGPFLPDLIAGQISVAITGVPSLLPSVKAGRLRALAVASAKRLTLLPELPTIAEAGVPGYEATQWNGVLAPAGAPQEVRARLHSAISAALQTADAREQLARMGGVPIAGSPDEFTSYIRTEISRWSKVVKEARLKPE